jgi:hypothetical protein
MKNTPETVEVTIYVYLMTGGGFFGCTTAGMENEGWVLLKTETVTIEAPQVNLVEIELEQLSKQETVIRAKFDEAMGNIKGRRAELLALEWQPERADKEDDEA